MKTLYVIPARGGSKGIPHKNIKHLNGKPLIYYSIDVARQLTTDENICVSTDDDEIIKAVDDYGLNVPFKRPDHLATDSATTNDVIIHALDYYESKGVHYDVVILLQPTSPLRKATQVKEAIDLYNNQLDMIVSVKESKSATVICSENEDGYLEFSLNKSGSRRQNISSYYEYNGAIYIINTESLKINNISGLSKKKKYVMDEISSVDVDTPLDWFLVESIINQQKV
ncbi:MAG: acylneuraminate cytidylyltransferase family protein [Tissierellia bacterium]|nr:acylneuraminate cytidylyltransferase family protein [Tissierellia bacterium]MDD4781036.1 acylneuraminate cytidylyltransferase family protein [Tissierellia bacterium]